MASVLIVTALSLAVQPTRFGLAAFVVSNDGLDRTGDGKVKAGSEFLAELLLFLMEKLSRSKSKFTSPVP